MSDRVRLVVLDVATEVVCRGEHADLLAARVRDAWDRCLDDTAAEAGSEDPPPRISLELELDDPEAVRPVMDGLTTRLTKEALARRIGQWWLLHACAVADPATGATAVLVAPSGTGKTTAARTLGQKWSYLTDETAAIDADGRITPYPKPLSLLVDGRRPKDQVSPTRLGLLPAVESPRLAGIALLDRDPGADGVQVTDVPTVEALALLAEQTSSMRLLPRPLHWVADQLDRVGGLRRIRYAEAGDLHDVVAGLVGAR